MGFCPCCDRMLSLEEGTGYFYCPECGWEEEDEDYD